MAEMWTGAAMAQHVRPAPGNPIHNSCQYIWPRRYRCVAQSVAGRIRAGRRFCAHCGVGL